MKIISWNVNGLRAVYKNGFIDWLRKSKADIVCLQEIKASPEQLEKDLIDHDSYYIYFNPAVKKGYSGAAVFTKEKPRKIHLHLEGVGEKTPSRCQEAIERFNKEGRFLRLNFENFVLINIYIPHGGRQKENLNYKLEVYSALFKYLEKLKNKNVILIGDFNIAHTEMDLARPKVNKNNIMFTLEEREQLDRLINMGYIDTFRVFNKESGNYTWWPYYANARERDLGWRIDYVFISNPLKSKLKKAFILKNDRGSDHCPVGIELLLHRK